MHTSLPTNPSVFTATSVSIFIYDPGTPKQLHTLFSGHFNVAYVPPRASLCLANQDAAAAESLQHVMSRLAEVAKAGGVYVDAYLVLSLMELAFGNLLQRLPSLLPVVQTTVRLMLLLLLLLL